MDERKLKELSKNLSKVVTEGTAIMNEAINSFDFSNLKESEKERARETLMQFKSKIESQQQETNDLVKRYNNTL